MEERRFMTFQEKVEPLSKDEQGRLNGGFVSIELGAETLADVKNKNTKLCQNENCTNDIKNKGAECKNTNCLCDCGGSNPNPNPPTNSPCSGIGHL